MTTALYSCCLLLRGKLWEIRGVRYEKMRQIPVQISSIIDASSFSDVSNWWDVRDNSVEKCVNLFWKSHCVRRIDFPDVRGITTISASRTLYFLKLLFSLRVLTLGFLFLLSACIFHFGRINRLHTVYIHRRTRPLRAVSTKTIRLRSGILFLLFSFFFFHSQILREANVLPRVIYTGRPDSRVTVSTTPG